MADERSFWSRARNAIRQNSDLIAIADTHTLDIHLYMSVDNDESLVDVTDLMRLNYDDYLDVDSAESVRSMTWNDNSVISGLDVPVELHFDGMYQYGGTPCVSCVVAETEYHKGEPWSDITVNLPVLPSPGCVFLDGHDYNQDAIDAAIDAGLISKTGRREANGFLMFDEARISPFVTGIFPEKQEVSLDILEPSSDHELLFWVTSDNRFVRGRKPLTVQLEADDEVSVDIPVSLDFDPELSKHNFVNVNGVAVDSSTLGKPSTYINAIDNPCEFDVTRDSVVVHGLHVSDKGDYVNVSLPALSNQNNRIRINVPFNRDYLNISDDVVHQGDSIDVSFNVDEQYTGWGKSGAYRYKKSFDTTDLLKWAEAGVISVSTVEGLNLDKDLKGINGVDWDKLSQSMSAESVNLAKDVSVILTSSNNLEEAQRLYRELLNDGGSSKSDTDDEHDGLG